MKRPKIISQSEVLAVLSFQANNLFKIVIKTVWLIEIIYYQTNVGFISNMERGGNKMSV